MVLVADAEPILPRGGLEALPLMDYVSCGAALHFAGTYRGEETKRRQVDGG